MAIWYVHRNDTGAIASAHSELQSGYAEEALDESDPELAAYLTRAQAKPAPPLDANAKAMMERRADELEKGDTEDQIEALKIRMSLLGG